MKQYEAYISSSDGGMKKLVYGAKNKADARAKGRQYIKLWQIPGAKLDIREVFGSRLPGAV